MRYFLRGVNASGVEPVKHEQENEDNQPQINATPILPNPFLLGDLHEGVDERDGQHVGKIKTGAIA